MWVSVTCCDQQVRRLRRLDVLPHIAIRIDDDGFTGGGAADQVAVLGDEGFEETLDNHFRTRSYVSVHVVHNVHIVHHVHPVHDHMPKTSW